VELTAHAGVLHVETSSTVEALPLGPDTVNVVLDGSILEVCTGTALVGLRIDAVGDLGRPDRPDAILWWWLCLTRSAGRWIGRWTGPVTGTGGRSCRDDLGSSGHRAL
jgi:hypothetical protein